MSSFKPDYLAKLTLHPSIGWALERCGEARGLQEFWRRTKPETISQLRTSAIVQSTESSNRIEGVEVDKERLKPLVLEGAKPRDRSEEEIVGYKKALQWIHKSHAEIEISPSNIKKLHKMAQGGLVSDAGQWKKKDNEIIEFSSKGDRRVRFKCTPAKKTADSVGYLCERFHYVREKGILPDILADASFVFDFLCIHPFRDGNGRVSRLLTLLLLYQNGYEVGRYISLERIVENTKDDYYETLRQSSVKWHESSHDLFPWWSYFLGHIRAGYQELKDKVEIQTGDTKSALVRSIIAQMDSSFTISDILNLQPNLDREIVKKVLGQMRDEKLLRLVGKGRGARWKIL